MLRHHRKVSQRYSKTQTKHWLAWLARNMVHEQKTIFLIERIQPNWLVNRTQKIVYSTLLRLLCGIVFGLTSGLVFGLTGGLAFGLTGGLIFGSLLGLRSNQEINPVETVDWDWYRTRLENRLNFDLTRKEINRLIVGLIVWLAFRLISELNIELFLVMAFGLIFGLIGGLIGSNVESKSSPNQGIFRSARNAVKLGLFSGLIFGLIGGLIYGLIGGLISGLISTLLMSILSNAGIACIQHFVLRMILFSSGHIPWNYARFLDYATERIVLQKVGGGYIFVHRLLLEHFAALEPEQRGVN